MDPSYHYQEGEESESLLAGAHQSTTLQHFESEYTESGSPGSLEEALEHDASNDNDNDDDSVAKEELSCRSQLVSRRMKKLTFIAAIGGFLSGYNTGVISGALLPLTRIFNLTALQEESIVSATIASAFLASIAGGAINTRMGRRRTLLLAAVIFTAGALVLFLAQNYSMLVLGEILLGIGIGLESLTSPLYIAEVAKPSIRGMLVSAYALMMCLGQFSAGIIDGIFGAVPMGWRFMFGMAALPGMAMFIGFLGLPESPAWLMTKTRSRYNCQQQMLFEEEEEGEEEMEDPCELVSSARSILQSVRDSDNEVELELRALQNMMARSSHSAEASVWQQFKSMMQHNPTRNALLVGCGLMVLQQICGVNGVMYYAASIYEMAGFEEVTSIWLSAFTAFAQIVGLAMSVILIETKGRRVLILTSFVLIGLCSIGLGWAFYGARVGSDPVNAIRMDPFCAQQAALVWDGKTRNCYDCTSIPGCGFCGKACVQGTTMGPLLGYAEEDHPEKDSWTCPVDSDWSYNVCSNPYGWCSVLFMVCYLIVFGVGAAGLPWTINSEIYPVQHRSLAVSISTGTNWLSNLLVSSTFLTINSPAVLTSYGSFAMYGIICFLGAAWLYDVLPETKGLSMEEIEEAFTWNHHESSYDWHHTRGEQESLLLNRQRTEESSFATKYNRRPSHGSSDDDTVVTTLVEESDASTASSFYGSLTLSSRSDLHI